MTLQATATIANLRARISEARSSGKSIGLVPTMGALHAGHGALIEKARRENGCVVVSIFVNPTQFNRQDDYQAYPRHLQEDLGFCESRGVDLVFAPSVKEMYPDQQAAFVEVEKVSKHLCGEFRPGHFRGVATVVLKLFDIAAPDEAYFGEKDAQQLAVIRRMVRDLNLPIRIKEVPTARERDGLAISSRNAHLSPEERKVAPLLYQALLEAKRLIDGGARRGDEVSHRARAVLDRQLGVKVEYLEIVDPEEIQPVEKIEGPVRVAAAIWLGETRLIDNVLVLRE